MVLKNKLVIVYGSEKLWKSIWVKDGEDMINIINQQTKWRKTKRLEHIVSLYR